MVWVVSVYELGNEILGMTSWVFAEFFCVGFKTRWCLLEDLPSTWSVFMAVARLRRFFPNGLLPNSTCNFIYRITSATSFTSSTSNYIIYINFIISLGWVDTIVPANCDRRVSESICHAVRAHEEAIKASFVLPWPWERGILDDKKDSKQPSAMTKFKLIAEKAPYVDRG